MRLNRIMRGGLLGLLAVFVLASGCTGSDKLNPGSGQIVVQVSTQNSTTRFDTAFVGLLQIEVVPVDPGIAAAAGIHPVGVLDSANRPGDIDFALDGNQFVIPVTLGTGRWRIRRILFDNMNFFDFDPPPSEDSCEEFISFYSLPDKVRIQDFGQDVIFEVDNTGRTSLTITVDGQKFAEGFQAGFQCVELGGQAAPGTPCLEAWCIQSNAPYDPSQLDMRASEFLDFS